MVNIDNGIKELNENIKTLGRMTVRIPAFFMGTVVWSRDINTTTLLTIPTVALGVIINMNHVIEIIFLI